jgi:hypothetical protein
VPLCSIFYIILFIENAQLRENVQSLLTKVRYNFRVFLLLIFIKGEGGGNIILSWTRFWGNRHELEQLRQTIPTTHMWFFYRDRITSFDIDSDYPINRDCKLCTRWPSFYLFKSHSFFSFLFVQHSFSKLIPVAVFRISVTAPVVDAISIVQSRFSFYSGMFQFLRKIEEKFIYFFTNFYSEFDWKGESPALSVVHCYKCRMNRILKNIAFPILS